MSTPNLSFATEDKEQRKILSTPTTQLGLILSSLQRDRLALFGGLIILLAIGSALLAPWLAPHDPYAMRSELRLAPPGTPDYLLGTDEVGRDMLSRLLWGGRISLQVAFIPVIISACCGLLLGLIAGFYGGWLDNTIMRLLDILFAFPSILLAIGIVAAMGPGITNLMIAMTIVAIPTYARLVRGLVLRVRELEYVEASLAGGASTSRLLFRQILPNILSPIIVYSTLEMGRMVIFAAGLSFLGLGVQPPVADWGTMLANGRQVLAVAPHVATIPGLMIFLVTLGFNLLGDGLRDALDPRLKV